MELSSINISFERLLTGTDERIAYGRRNEEIRVKIIPRRILENLKESHPSFNDICKAVKNKYPHMSRSTVHNNLKSLEKLGLITCFNHNGETRYELNLDLHVNVVEKDGTIRDMKDIEITRHLEEIVKIIREKGKSVKIS